jgi:signal transduction histidine kinase
VAAFTASGFLVLTLVGVGGVLVLRRIGTDQATREAQRLVDVTARGVIQPRLTDGIVRGDADSLIAVEALVHPAVLRDPIVAVRLVTDDGTIVYADDPGLIGLPATDAPAASGPVFVSEIATPEGTPLAFRAELRADAITAGSSELVAAFLPVLAVALVVLALLQVPLAARLGRSVQRSREDRERLLRHAVEASDRERRRIAADLHDGSVQQLAGLSMSLAARADELAASDPVAARALQQASAETRRGMRSIRSAVLGISPPDLQRAGLSSALSDLTTPLAAEGLRAQVDVERMELPPDVETLLYRASQEAVRNVVAHADARQVSLRVMRDGTDVVLEVVDDGCGFGTEARAAAGTNGHVGLRLLDDLARDAGGTLDVTSSPGSGTRLRLEVPIG